MCCMWLKGYLLLHAEKRPFRYVDSNTGKVKERKRGEHSTMAPLMCMENAVSCLSKVPSKDTAASEQGS